MVNCDGVETRKVFDIATEVAFFYGVPELGQNLVWKDFDTDPSLHLNPFSKVKSFLKPFKLLARLLIKIYLDDR